MLVSLSGKTALITGGCGGLGLAISKAFLKAGANAIACDINSANDKAFRDSEDASSPGRLLTHQCDVTNEQSLEQLFKASTNEFGTIDYVINNAAVMDAFDPVGTCDKTTWDRVIATNITAPYMVSRLAVQHMLENSVKGAVVNVASLAATKAYAGGAAYVTSKHALAGLTKNTAAFYFSKGIRCNAVLPGSMETNITAHLAGGYSEEGMQFTMRSMDTSLGFTPVDNVARTVLFLCSEEASSINGACVPVDQGLHLI